MNDINFDELDKAVNSVLNTPKHVKPAEAEESQALEAAEPTTQEVPEQDVPKDQPAQNSFAPQKRRGQFMDMVHPSSDMTKAGDVPSLRRPTQKLEPLSPAIVEADADAEVTEQPAVDTVVAAKEEDLSENQESSEGTHDDASSDEEIDVVNREWPDPLDSFLEQPVEAVDTPAQEEISPDLREDEPSYEEPSAGVLPEGLEAAFNEDLIAVTEDSHESPFIESVDVEKRPLGAFTGEGNEKPVGAIEVESTLQGAEQEEDSESEDEVIAPVEANKQPEAAQSTEPASIVQQYRVDSEPADTEEHAVFDTEQYHQPLVAEKPKKNHGLLYALLALLMIGLGAGVGYAIFVLRLL